jgi:spore coat protein U-like protein
MSARLRPALLATALLAVLLRAPAGHAAVTSCTVTATGPVFGTYNPLQPTALASTATVTTVCVVTSHRNTITIGLSTGVSGNFTARQMTTVAGGTTYTLTYNLFQDAADSIIWGDGTGASQIETVTLTRHGGNNTITTATTVYAEIPALQDPVPGAYGDIITVTVNY